MSYIDNKKRILAKIDDRFEDKLAVIGELVAGHAKANCPVGVYKDGTVGGRLKSAISWKTYSDDGGYGSHPNQQSDDVSRPEKGSARVGFNVDYGLFVELGIRGRGHSTSGKGMLRNALQKNRTEIKRILAL